MEQLMRWWRERAERERVMLMVGAAAVAVLLLLAALLPLQRSVAQARTRLESKQSALAWLQSVEPQLAATASTTTASGESLLALAERTAREAGIGKALTGGQPGGNGAWRLRLENVAFDGMAGWLAQLSTRHGVMIESATIDGRDAAGAVNATLVLRQR